MDKALCFELCHIKFEIYDQDEIQKVPVLKLSNPLVLDTLGHPAPFGVYDLKLGPCLDNNSICGTCKHTIFQCPGHFGIIKLPAPVINPLFHDAIISLLNASCTACNSFKIPDHLKLQFLAQVMLLKHGLISLVNEIPGIIKNVINVNVSCLYEEISESKPEFEDRTYNFSKCILSCIEKEINNYIHVHEKDAQFQESFSTKSEFFCKNILVKNFLKESSKYTLCAKCGAKSRRKISIHNSKILVHQFDFDNKKRSKLSSNTNVFSDEFLKSSSHIHFTAVILKHFLRKLWKKEKTVLIHLYEILKPERNFPTDVFFIDTLLVPPPRIRPLRIVSGSVMEHPQSITYNNILLDCLILKNLSNIYIKDRESSIEDTKKIISDLSEENMQSTFENAFERLQDDINFLYDANFKKSQIPVSRKIGLKQVLEKKEGLFRQNMMGKRVNFSARSVISPDPMIGIDEIGIPDYFAKVLTYPVPVTSWNVKAMKHAIINGPNIHPGATLIENEDGHTIYLSPNNIKQRKSIAKRIMTPSDLNLTFLRSRVVHRHLVSGDMILMNRQPTLHRPSIMAHRARILCNTQTLRMHYANCKAYNADFDGDEMNAHFPQNELARSEANNLVNVCKQFLVPKDGTPLHGLIQDHVISSVKLSMRGTFFPRNDYLQLVYSSLPYLSRPFKLLPPTLIKPQILWSGKQIISTILINCTPHNKEFITLHGKSKISERSWKIDLINKKLSSNSSQFNPSMADTEFIIQNGELLCGILDKAHIGATCYGLIHCFYEMYGPKKAIHLLTAFSRLFTFYLQLVGFSVGIEDILLDKNSEKKRSKIIKKVHKIGNTVASKAFCGFDNNIDITEIQAKYHNFYSNNDQRMLNNLDRVMKSECSDYTNKITEICSSQGLLKKFPENNLHLMILSGAKGSVVNAMQISCLLGQIELEGKRPPLMQSGKFLPSYQPFDTSPKSGGYISNRFLTGLSPQEFFFHCMAGREGLIDTAIKTSRSGYLQRCLVKHLEGVIINYDLTVRDSDGSLIQFKYGDDGLDVSESKFLKQDQFAFLLTNSCNFISTPNNVQVSKMEMHFKDFKNKYLNLNNFKNIHKNNHCSVSPFCEENSKQVKMFSWNSKWNRSMKSIQMWKKEKIGKICKENEENAFLNANLLTDLQLFCFEKNLKLETQKLLFKLLYIKNSKAFCHPGEPVGLLASQSIGEPSTQMTLNTFHFAGCAEMNVTLGIPRLKEILLSSMTTKTPTMDLPMIPKIANNVENLENLCAQMSCVTLFQVLQYAEIKEKINNKQMSTSYKKFSHITPSYILNYMEEHFFEKIFLPFIFKELHSSYRNTLDTQEETSSNLNDDTFNSFEDCNELASYALKHENEEEIFFLHEDEINHTLDFSEERKLNIEGNAKLEEEKHEYYEPDYYYSSLQRKPNDNHLRENEKKAISNEQPRIKESKVNRCFNVCQIHPCVTDYKFDTHNQSWCEISIQFDAYMKKIDFSLMLPEISKKSIIHHIPGINRAIILNDSKGKPYIKTDGGILKFCSQIDVSHTYINDIFTVANLLGIEAARKTIIIEIKCVFEAYGITVDLRHLLLIADYMTWEGTLRPFSCLGLSNSASPMQQMSFEATMTHLKTATLTSSCDYLKSPSSRLVTGQVPLLGTGCFDIIYNKINYEK